MIRFLVLIFVSVCCVFILSKHISILWCFVCFVFYNFVFVYSQNKTWGKETDFEKLIELVRNHEDLYNVQHVDYPNGELHKNLWDSFGKILGMKGESLL